MRPKTIEDFTRLPSQVGYIGLVVLTEVLIQATIYLFLVSRIKIYSKKFNHVDFTNKKNILIKREIFEIIEEEIIDNPSKTYTTPQNEYIRKIIPLPVFLQPFLMLEFLFNLQATLSQNFKSKLYIWDGINYILVNSNSIDDFINKMKDYSYFPISESKKSISRVNWEIINALIQHILITVVFLIGYSSQLYRTKNMPFQIMMWSSLIFRLFVFIFLFLIGSSIVQNLSSKDK